MTDPKTPKTNVPEFSVSDLAFSLKKTLEENYGRVRVRGELSRVSIAGSGHMYSSLKDDKAVIDAVCWRGTLSRLPVKPEEGLEVICTGRVSTYPARSNYQLIIESMALAGEGALLKMLEERRKKLAGEGLFDKARKKALPFLPEVIGVVTSPTGAVIRDILHRLEDRFPRHVLLWPVMVQGEGAPAKITAAIEGFQNIHERGLPRPDVLIVARGGGSLEDLMAFNEENVVRAVAASDIPVISAVGHETDTTLIDYAADKRAPTPTGAAEIAVPVRRELMSAVMERGQRLFGTINRQLAELRHRLEAQAARLGEPARLMEAHTQHLDRTGDKIENAFRHYLSDQKQKLIQTGARLRKPEDRIRQEGKRLERWSEQLLAAGAGLIPLRAEKLDYLGKMLSTLSFENILARGFTVIYGPDGHILTGARQATPGTPVKIRFKEAKFVEAVIGKSGKKAAKKSKKKDTEDKQRRLF